MTTFVSGNSILVGGDNDGPISNSSPFVSENEDGGVNINTSGLKDTGLNLTLVGDGNDRVYTSQNSAPDIIDLGGGDDITNAGGHDDLVYGGDGDDIIRGGSGDDDIFGGTGDDQLIGGDGSDLIEGGDGDDIIWGAAGDDIIRGGKGADVLSGGLGSDTFIIKGEDLTYDQGNVDVVDAIVDFNDNEDVFVLQDMPVNGVVSYDSATGDVTFADSADPDVSKVIANLQTDLDIDVVDQGDGNWTLL